MTLLLFVINTIFSLYSLALIASTFLGMLLGPFHPVTVFLRRITEPVLAPIRRYIPPIRSGNAAWDLSPMVAILLLWIIEQILTRILLAFV